MVEQEKKVLGSEEIKKEIDNEAKVARIVLGVNNDCKIEVPYEIEKGKKTLFEFFLHYPSIEDDRKIAIKTSDLCDGKTIAVEQKFFISMLATLDTVIDEIYITDEIGKRDKYDKKYYDLLKEFKNSKLVYQTLFYPVLDQYNIFMTKSTMEYDELKKVLARLRKG